MNGRMLEPHKLEVNGLTLHLWWDNQALIDVGRQLSTKGPQEFYTKLSEVFSKYTGGEVEFFWEDYEVISSLIYGSVCAGARKTKTEVPITPSDALELVNEVSVWLAVYRVMFGTAPDESEVTESNESEKKNEPQMKPGT